MPSGGDTTGDGASAHPGLASTVVTRELAQLWRSLSPTERRPYRYVPGRTGHPDTWVPLRPSIPPSRGGGVPRSVPSVPCSQRARQFSRQHDRVVRLVGDKDGDGDTDPPAPLQLLLAAHAGTLGGGPLSP